MRTPLEARLTELLHAVADATPTEHRPAPRLTPGAARSADVAEAAELTAEALAFGAAGPARGRASRTRRVLVGAAAAAIVAGGVGVVVALDRAPTTTAAAPPATWNDPTTVPKIVIPGWNTAAYRASRSTDDGGIRVTLVLRDPQQGLAGPVVRVGTTRAPNGYSVGDPATEVEIGDHQAEMSTAGETTSITWDVGQGRTTFVVATGLSSDQVVAVARGLQADAAGVPVAAAYVPPSLTATALPPLPASSTYGEYELVEQSRSLKVSFYAGGPSIFELRSMGDPRAAVAVRGTTGLLLDYGGGRYRVDAVLGPWTWEADGTGFASASAFLAAVDDVTIVDDAAWRASLPAGTDTTGAAGTSGTSPAAESPASAVVPAESGPSGSPAPTAPSVAKTEASTPDAKAKADPAG